MNQWLGAPPPPPPPPPGDGAGALEPVTVSVAVLLVVEPAALLTTTAYWPALPTWALAIV
jgi:hypothetical protein